MYVFMVVLGLHYCMVFSLVGVNKGSSLVEVVGFFIALAYLVAEYGF